MFKEDWGSETKGWGGVWTDGSKGTQRAGKGAPMGGNTQQCQSAKGEPSVCEIDPHVSLPSRSLTAGLCNGRLTAPPVSSFGSSMMNFMAVIPTCCCAVLVYLFKHIDRILYILTFQSMYRLTVLPLAHAHPPPCVTAAFHVWYAVHLHSLQIADSVQSNTFQVRYVQDSTGIQIGPHCKMHVTSSSD